MVRPALTPDPTLPLKIVVIDDDPTGSQSVHGAPLLLRWDQQTLLGGLCHPSPLLFVLANSRALAPDEARARMDEITRALRSAFSRAHQLGLIDRVLLVSRGDSTLRGHFPLEAEAIREELGPFDATVLVPAFLEGGRTTVGGVHLLHGEPVHRSAFARDGLFAYTTSHLPSWMEEKSGGRIPADQVERIDLAELDAAAASEAGARRLRERLAGRRRRRRADVDAERRGMDVDAERRAPALDAERRAPALDGEHRWLVVDAERPEQLETLASLVRDLSLSGGDGSGGRAPRFLFQSAASLLGPLAGLGPQPSTPHELAALRRRGPQGAPLPGLVLVGSHVPLADAQLERLLAEPACDGVEISAAKVHRILEGPLPRHLLASLEEAWEGELLRVLAAGRTPVLFTSRRELRCRHAAERRALGLALASAMARLAARLEPRLGYLISKGGITSHQLLAEGLNLAAVELQGQLLAGLSLVLTPQSSAGAGRLPVLTFPGNLGDSGTLVEAWRWMEDALRQAL